MPQASQRLQDKFGIGGDRECLRIIEEAGGTIERGDIKIARELLTDNEELCDAIDFLCGEWDYSFTSY